MEMKGIAIQLGEHGSERVNMRIGIISYLINI